MGIIGWPHILLLLAVVLLLFGAARLPVLAKNLGLSARLFKGEINAMKKESDAKAPELASDDPKNPDASPPNRTGLAGQ